MALANASKCLSSLVLGTCRPCLKHNASKFKVQYLFFDEYLKKYFRKSFEVFAYDPQKICKVGDVVLIQELPHKMTSLITHEVLEVVYPFGDITDPITGKKVSGRFLRDQLKNIGSLYGDTESNFEYELAPERGWQEGKKDFSHRPIYRRYNEFEDGDEDKDQPESKYM